MKPLRLDPRTKLCPILFCVLCAMLAPNLFFQFALVVLIALLAALSGKWRYALRGVLVYGLICAFTAWCMGRGHRHMANDACGLSGAGA